MICKQKIDACQLYDHVETITKRHIFLTNHITAEYIGTEHNGIFGTFTPEHETKILVHPGISFVNFPGVCVASLYLNPKVNDFNISVGAIDHVQYWTIEFDKLKMTETFDVTNYNVIVCGKYIKPDGTGIDIDVKIFIENSICILQKDGINYIYDDKLGIWVNQQYEPSYKIVNL